MDFSGSPRALKPAFGNPLKEMFKAIFFISLFFCGLLQAQSGSKLIRIVSAESFSFDQEKNNAKLLTGNVVCEHDGALLYCDTAYIYQEDNRMSATGHILITKGDSIRVTGDKLFYDGKTKIATLTNNVKCIEKDMTLTTNLLTFDVGRSIANYYDGGTIVNKENTLVSKNGHYYSATKEAAFHYSVVLTNPDYKMNSDTLKYRFPNKTSYFLGPSIILSKTDYIYCENGWYDTDKEKAAFSKNALLVTSQQKLKGDSLFYDRTLKFGKAFRNVSLVDTSQKSIIYGDYIEYKELKSEALVTKKAIYARILDQDTLFIAADTLYHRDVDSVDNFLNAYHHVRIFKKDLQAICDSSTLNTKDSLLQLFKTPVLWSHNSQATSRVIKVDIGKNDVKGFKLDGKAFLIQQLDSVNTDKFNQLSGKIIDGFIREDTVRKVVVTGNAEIMYYPKNKDKIVGLNNTTCEIINMWMKSGEVEKVTLKPKTVGKIDPLVSVDVENAKLKGFNWLYNKRPVSRFDLHPHREVIEVGTDKGDVKVPEEKEKNKKKESKKKAR
jgi:lipopolysaccharide export system protein LptA